MIILGQNGFRHDILRTLFRHLRYERIEWCTFCRVICKILTQTWFLIFLDSLLSLYNLNWSKIDTTACKLLRRLIPPTPNNDCGLCRFYPFSLLLHLECASHEEFLPYFGLIPVYHVLCVVHKLDSLQSWSRDGCPKEKPTFLVGKRFSH